MPSATKRIAALIEERNADAVAEAVRDLDAADRRAVARVLPAHVREVRSRVEPWDDILDHAPAFRAAGAGTLAGASAVAAWLNRREFSTRWSGEHRDTDLLLGLWDDRDDAWRADLARRLTLRLRGPRHVGLDLVLALLAETGVEPPEHDPLVVGWVSSAPPRAKDPLLPFLPPRVFEADGVGRELRERPSWPRTLATLAGRGEVDGRMLLDGCVRRFLRGGTALDLRFFVRLHGLLMPDDPAARQREISAHARDYVRLLPTAPGTVADLALGLLREVPALPSEEVVEALDGVLFRPETGLVKSGLSWLEQTVQRRPGLAAGCGPALARAFGHESYAVQQRAVRIALRFPDGADAPAITDAVPLLPADLGARVAARFGGDVAEPGGRPGRSPAGPAAAAARDRSGRGEAGRRADLVRRTRRGAPARRRGAARPRGVDAAVRAGPPRTGDQRAADRAAAGRRRVHRAAAGRRRRPRLVQADLAAAAAVPSGSSTRSNGRWTSAPTPTSGGRSPPPCPCSARSRGTGRRTASTG